MIEGVERTRVCSGSSKDCSRVKGYLSWVLSGNRIVTCYIFKRNMTWQSKLGFKAITPILCVDNVVSSLEHYSKVLGFEIEWSWSEEGFGKGIPTFACVKRGEVCFFLAQQNQGTPGAWASLFLDNADELDSVFQEYQLSGADIVEEPIDKPWGMREMLVKDIDGNTFRIGCSLNEKC